MAEGNRSDPKVIRIAAALIVDDAGRALLVRKRGTAVFMQAGGKIEADESHLEALARELKEELNIELADHTPAYLGQFSAAAANEAGYIVTAEIFHLRLTAAIRPAAEIEEILWIDPRDPPPITIAPLSRDHILPLVPTLRPAE